MSAAARNLPAKHARMLRALAERVENAESPLRPELAEPIAIELARMDAPAKWSEDEVQALLASLDEENRPTLVPFDGSS